MADELFSGISRELVDALNTSEKETFLATLKKLIESIDKAQEDFLNLKVLFDSILRMMPQAIWVIEENEFFYFNPQASKIEGILDLGVRDGEIEFNGSFFLMQSACVGNKQILTATDITIQKRQERLALMGQVSAHLSHEIRNPVGSISILASTLLDRVDGIHKPMVHEIQKSIWRVETLIKATLMFSKGVCISRKKHRLDSLLSRIRECMSYFSYTKRIDFRLNIPEDIDVFCDLDLMEIVLQNFISNAIDSIEENDDESGFVSVDFYHEDGFSFFEIRDSGEEIKDDSVLFEPFKSTKLKGTGLGLALSRQIIQAHEGSIELLNPKCFLIKIKNI